LFHYRIHANLEKMKSQLPTIHWKLHSIFQLLSFQILVQWLSSSLQLLITFWKKSWHAKFLTQHIQPQIFHFEYIIYQMLSIWWLNITCQKMYVRYNAFAMEYILDMMLFDGWILFKFVEFVWVVLCQKLCLSTFFPKM